MPLVLLAVEIRAADKEAQAPVSVGDVGDAVHRPRAAHMAPALAAVFEAPVSMVVRTEMQAGRVV